MEWPINNINKTKVKMHAYKLIFMKEVLDSQKFSPETFLIRYYRTRIQNGKKNLFLSFKCWLSCPYTTCKFLNLSRKKKTNYNTLSKWDDPGMVPYKLCTGSKHEHGLISCIWNLLGWKPVDITIWCIGQLGETGMRPGVGAHIIISAVTEALPCVWNISGLHSELQASLG